MQVRRKYLAKYGEMEKTKPHLEETWHSDKKRGGGKGGKGDITCILQAAIFHTRLSSAQLELQPGQFTFL